MYVLSVTDFNNNLLNQYVLLADSQSVFCLGKLFFDLAALWMNMQCGALLQYRFLATWMDCFTYRFAVGFDEQHLQILNFQAASENKNLLCFFNS